MSRPFMLWHGQPCWIGRHEPDGVIVATPRPLWTYESLTRPGLDITQGINVSATFATWSLLFAHAIAKAYRPEGIP